MVDEGVVTVSGFNSHSQVQDEVGGNGMETNRFLLNVQGGDKSSGPLECDH
mgnify:CR=1 FL=1